MIELSPLATRRNTMPTTIIEVNTAETAIRAQR